MSRRFVPHETTSGGDVITPPKDCHPPQDDPVHQRCHNALSVPTTKTSSRFGPQATTRGGDSRTPANDSQPPQLAGSSNGKTLSVPVSVTGVPAGKCLWSR